MNKYLESKIYKITDNNNNLCYFGSTIRNLTRRFNEHKNEYKHNCLSCSVKKIFDEYGIENCKIELVENYQCNNKNELRKREGFFIQNNECVNKLTSGRTIEESNLIYRKKNKELLKDKSKNYYENNKDKIHERRKKNYENNKDRINEKRRENYKKNLL